MTNHLIVVPSTEAKYDYSRVLHLAGVVQDDHVLVVHYVLGSGGMGDLSRRWHSVTLVDLTPAQIPRDEQRHIVNFITPGTVMRVVELPRVQTPLEDSAESALAGATLADELDEVLTEHASSDVFHALGIMIGRGVARHRGGRPMLDEVMRRLHAIAIDAEKSASATVRGKSN